jgi:hypothetical protein
MGFLRKVKGGSVPAWAAYMSPDEYKRFRKLVDGWLSAHSNGFAEVEGGGIDVDMGLESLVDGTTTEPDMAWGAVRDILKVRIYPDSYGQGLPAGAGPLLVSREVAGGIVAALAVDYPKTVASVPPDTAAGWGKPIDELFDIGMANVRSADRPVVERQELEGGSKLTILAGDSFFTATWALMLDDFATGNPANGEIVAIPNRHMVGFVPIVDLSVVAAITPVITFALQFYEQGPGPVTQNIYWRHDGRLTLLPTELEGQTVRFAPPAEFIEMLNGLHKPGA